MSTTTMRNQSNSTEDAEWLEYRKIGMTVMRKCFLTALFCLLARGVSLASLADLDFHRMHREDAAERLLQAAQYPEAQAAYDALAADAPDPVARKMAEARAAVALGLQPNRYADGLARAAAIDDRAYATQARMQLMFARERFAELLEAYGDEDIAAWPERRLPTEPPFGRPDVRGLAFFDRGRAFRDAGEHAAAARDLAQAEALSESPERRAVILYKLASLYSATGESERVFETYLALARNGRVSWHFFQGVFRAAEYLRARERYDEALEVIALMRPEAFRGAIGMHVRGLTMRGRILAEAGRYAEAADAFRTILDNRAVSVDGRAAAKLALGRVRVAAGDLETARKAYRTLADWEEAKDDHREQARTALDALDQPPQ